MVVGMSTTAIQAARFGHRHERARQPRDVHVFLVESAQCARAGIRAGVGGCHALQCPEVLAPVALLQQVIDPLHDLRIGMPAQPRIREFGARVYPHAIGHRTAADILAYRLCVAGQLQRLVGRTRGVDCRLDIDVAKINLRGPHGVAVTRQLLGVVLGDPAQVEVALLAAAGVRPGGGGRW
ncbi:hypothetical protein G6F24_014923 [Rhizopus arrhizus]|nr:hypothetical protein G6F24_014923 [Rhizopus arrhizus]